MSEKPELTDDEKVVVAVLDRIVASIDLAVIVKRLSDADAVLTEYSNKINRDQANED